MATHPGRTLVDTDPLLPASSPLSSSSPQACSVSSHAPPFSAVALSSYYVPTHGFSATYVSKIAMQQRCYVFYVGFKEKEVKKSRPKLDRDQLDLASLFPIFLRKIRNYSYHYWFFMRKFLRGTYVSTYPDWVFSFQNLCASYTPHSRLDQAGGLDRVANLHRRKWSKDSAVKYLSMRKYI